MNRNLDGREESELEARKFREKEILIFGGYSLGKVNQFWHGEEQRNVPIYLH